MALDSSSFWAGKLMAISRQKKTNKWLICDFILQKYEQFSLVA
jgi:hypothetical protein